MFGVGVASGIVEDAEACEGQELVAVAGPADTSACGLSALGHRDDGLALKPEGEETLDPLVDALAPNAEVLGDSGLARIAVAILIDVGGQAAQHLPEVIWKRGKEARVPSLEVHLDEHPGITPASRDVDLPLELDGDEGLPKPQVSGN